MEVVEDGYIAGGFKEINNRTYEYIIKVGSQGEQVWEHVGNSPGAHVKDLIVASDGSIWATGYRNANISLVKLGSQGIYQWGRTYDPGIGYGLAELANGDFVIAGYGNILGIKPTGIKSWAQNLADTASGMDVYVKSVAAQGSGVMIFTGSVDSG